jgi:hypothetical protein
MNSILSWSSSRMNLNMNVRNSMYKFTFRQVFYGALTAFEWSKCSLSARKQLAKHVLSLQVDRPTFNSCMFTHDSYSDRATSPFVKEIMFEVKNWYIMSREVRFCGEGGENLSSLGDMKSQQREMQFIWVREVDMQTVKSCYLSQT